MTGGPELMGQLSFVIFYSGTKGGASINVGFSHINNSEYLIRFKPSREPQTMYPNPVYMLGLQGTS